MKADQWQTLEFAAKYGFESIEGYAAQLAAMSPADMDRLKSQMKEKKLRWGAARASGGFPAGRRALRRGHEEAPVPGRGAPEGRFGAGEYLDQPG